MSSARFVSVLALAAAMFITSSATAQITGPVSPGPPVAGEPASNPTVIPDGGPAALYVARRGWHIDIGFSVGELRAP
jgi:hypothetical protein